MAGRDLEGRRVRVLSTKYDGSLHNDYEAVWLDAGGLRGLDGGDPSDGALRLFVAEGTPNRTYRGELAVRVPFTALFWPGADTWWNVYHNHWTTERFRIESYANITTPAEFDGETLRWVDLDLDVVIRAGVVELDDEDEFAEHLERWAYPEQVVRRARSAAAELVVRAESRTAPFNREAYLPRRGE